MTNWPQIIIDLQREHGISERRLAVISGVNRSTLRRMLQGLSSMSIGDLERLLHLFGYELEAVQIDPAHSRPLKKTRVIRILAKRREPVTPAPEQSKKPKLIRLASDEDGRRCR